MEKIAIAAGGPHAVSGARPPAVRCGDFVYVAGQIGCDPITGRLAEGLEAQTHQMLANVDAILAEAGLTNADIVTVTLMFSDMSFFKPVDVWYAAWLPPREEVPYPCCNAFATPGLPEGALVQLEVTAAVRSS